MTTNRNYISLIHNYTKMLGLQRSVHIQKLNSDRWKDRQQHIILNLYLLGSTVAVVVSASVLSFCGAISANFITYMDL